MPTIRGGGGGGTPSGAAGGDLTGTFPNPTIGTGKVTSTAILDGTILDADVSASAAIAISKLADPTTGKVIGSSGSAAAAVLPPGYQFDRAAITSNAASTQTTEASATTIITGGAVTYDGSTTVQVSVSGEGIRNGSAGVITFINIWRDTTDLGRVVRASNAASNDAPCFGTIQDTPSAGSHTYTAREWVASASTGTLIAGAGGVGTDAPAQLRVAKV